MRQLSGSSQWKALNKNRAAAERQRPQWMVSLKSSTGQDW